MPRKKLPQEKRRSRLINFKVNREERALVRKKAELYCEGNLAKWARLAAMSYTPDRAEKSVPVLTRVKKEKLVRSKSGSPLSRH